MAGWSAQADDGVLFNRDIRPILADKCFACHGPDKNRREADLRLDTEAGLLGDEGAGGVVTPGQPEASELFRRITADNPDQRMPPPDAPKALKRAEIDLVRRWIEQGAAWEGHWAFEPIRRPTPPAIEGGSFVKNPIDAFVLAAQRKQGLAPSPEADRRTLIRRLSLDLLGLPPSPAEVEAFLADSREHAYEALVDRLLQSPHFGERMAMWWLDLVRYADTVGYHGDQPVNVWPFRDYVIRAFNDNKPFDRFTREQLAGDLLPDPTLEQRIASGYNRLGMMSAEGGVQPKEYLAKYIAERVRNLGGVWLGVTTGCCECHDHKYDPFTSRDFYSLEAFFADIQERGLYSGANASGDWGPRVQVPTPEQARQLAELDRQIAALKDELDAPTPELARAQEQWEREQALWTVLTPETAASAGGAALTKQEDGSLLVSGENPDRDVYTLVVANPPRDITALRLEALPDDSLPKKGPGRGNNGNFVLSEFVARLRPAPDADEQPVTFSSAAASFEQTQGAGQSPHGKWAAAGAIDGDIGRDNHGWAVLEQVGKPNFAIFETSETIAGGDGAALTLELHHNYSSRRHTLGRFRVLATSAPRPVKLAEAPPPNVVALLALPADQRTAEQQAELAAYYRSIAPALAPVRKKLQDVEAARTALEQALPTTLVTVAVEPRTIKLLHRGHWMDESGEVLQPAFPALLAPSDLPRDRRLNRADLAAWLTSPENPLTARVFVNRLWKLYFGAGLSRRLDDLGAQGEWPSHPELLDWLAGRFIDSGWDIKQMVKLMVMSGTYRQTSDESPSQRERDPANRWLTHQARFRLDAEIVRDNALAISGLLVPKIGGPSVKPYQPPGYWAYLNFPTREWENGTGDELYRRGLYTHWQRQYLHPSLLAFDAPSREECTAERARSNTPLQSLALLNDPTYVEAARAFAERVLREGGATTESRLAWAFEQALARPIRPREADLLAKLLANHQGEYRQDPQAAAELLTVGAKPVADDLDQAEVAAWTSVARALLLLHETITRS